MMHWLTVPRAAVAGLFLLWLIGWVSLAATTPLHDYHLSLWNEGTLLAAAVFGIAISYRQLKLHNFMRETPWRNQETRRSRSRTYWLGICGFAAVNILAVWIYLRVEELEKNLLLYTAFIPVLATISVLGACRAAWEIDRRRASRSTVRGIETDPDAENHPVVTRFAQHAAALMFDMFLFVSSATIACQAVLSTLQDVGGRLAITPLTLSGLYILFAIFRRLDRWPQRYRRLAALVVLGYTLASFDAYAVTTTRVSLGITHSVVGGITLAALIVINRHAQRRRV